MGIIVYPVNFERYSVHLEVSLIHLEYEKQRLSIKNK